MNRIAGSLEKIFGKINNNGEELVVLSNYFTSKNDPVRGFRQQNDSFNYLANWYYSIHELRLMAIVFYDQLSPEFLERYSTDRIFFVHCKLGNFSLNDERFFIFKEFTSLLSPDTYVITTDINDVVFNKNPLALLKQDPEKVFVGRGDRRSWKSGIWTLKALKAFYDKYPGKVPPSMLHFPVLNPGTVGGKSGKVSLVFQKMCALFESIGDDGNYDMQAFNYVMMRDYVPFRSGIDKFVPFAWNYWYQYLSYRVHRKLEGKYRKEKYDLSNVGESIVQNEFIHAGFPFVSMFNWFEKKGESHAFLIHK
ncbi:hypothetical protein SAMN04488519_10759 [Algoriphagus ornithinivorans]|uniref:Rhamnan synthesis protein F n=1 Tax=Algoriphagus ornithinivorans TaxID=226506 RepID=A0A1I5HHV7_9BACT|nr:hypothetical protein [Algoriphagus ornithinivorans]SFO47918.1 hypothetical protein SAMN04488519_10759 [Algoriphagus ornithinivorans]